MVANTTPIFPLTPNINWGKVATANTAMDGTGTYGTTVILLFTAGAAGARVDEIRLKGLGTNIVTAVRIFVNTGADGSANAALNSLIYDKTIAATTASNNSELAELVIWPDSLVLPAGYKLYATTGVTIAAGIQITVIGADY
jgi:hypothetical protein